MMIAVVVGMCALAVAANVFVRHGQYEVWNNSSQATHYDGAPLFSTADAPFFLTHASAAFNQTDVSAVEHLRNYPNQLGSLAGDRQTSLTDRPLLSVLIGLFSSADEPSKLLTAAHQIGYIFTIATALFIVLCFGAGGYWLEGCIAAVGGSLSSAYLVRSSIGRIDTDQLNLGLIYLLFGLAVLAGHARGWRAKLAWCAAAGLVGNLFMWWYGKPHLILLAACSLAWLLVVQRNFIVAVTGVATFLLVSGVSFFNPFENVYLQDTTLGLTFLFPNTLSTVTEIRQVSMAQVLINATGSVEMGLVCLTGLAVFTFRHPVLAIAFGPLVAFGLLNFVIGNRAIFYSAPILWFGAAFLLTTTARLVAANLSETGNMVKRDQFAIIVASSLAMVIAWVNSPTSYVPRPSFPKPVLEGLASLKTSTDPANSVVATWWDYGYASMFFNGLPTLHDGGSQTLPSTFFVARAFLDHDQQQSIGNLKFLSLEGNKGIAAATSFAGLQEQFGKTANAASPDLFLVVTNQMAGWMGSISKIGNWDIETGRPITPRGNPNGPVTNYEMLNCRLAGFPQRLTCGSTNFDLERGLVNGIPALSGWAHSRDGYLVRSGDFDHDGDFAVQVVQNGSRVNAFLMHRQLFESTFNELYYLGQIDHPSISLHYDNYPHIRIYKIDGATKG